jgi:hypothetical protein
VRPADGGRREALKLWWSLLGRRSGRQIPSTIAELAQGDPKANYLVIASGSYVDAISEDLVEAAARLRHPERLVIVSGRDAAVAGLDSNIVPAGEALLSRVGGGRTSLHSRVALDLLLSLERPELQARGARERYAALTSAAPPVRHFNREPKSDSDVTNFIARALRRDPSVTHTRLLREFRTQGMACEQGRFRQLFASARERA